MNWRTTAVAAAVLAVLALAGCGNYHAPAGHPSASAAAASARAFASSSAGQLGKQDAKALFAHCLPPQAQQLSLAAWESAVKCGGVPKGSRLKAAECVLGNVERAGKLPKDKQARDEDLINAADPCIRQYQAGQS